MKGVGSAYVSATVTGDVAAVKAALAAGAEAASHVGTVVSAHVIARPQDDTVKVLPQPKAAARKSS